jgi:hypothetical protein
MKQQILGGLIAIVVLAGCQPENSFTREDIQTSVEDFYQKNRVTEHSYTVSGASGGVKTTAAGNKIYIPDNAFVTKTGTPVTGEVSISVKEYLTPYDMIINNMPTMADGVPLESGGEYKISATTNNQELELASGKFIRIQMTKGNSNNWMQVFKGTEDAQGNVNWTLDQAPGNIVVGDSTLFAGSSLFSSSIGWLNCDKFYNEPTVSFRANPVNAPSGDSINVFVHLTGRNTIVKMSWTRGLPYFESDKLLAVPSTFVGISVRNGKFYAGFASANVKDGGSISLNFSPYSEKELKKKLGELQ